MDVKNRFVRMETTKGTMDLELYVTRAPKTAERFMNAVNAGKYDGLKFHRIIQDFMVQGIDVLTSIAATRVGQAARGERSRPLEDVRIVKVVEIPDQEERLKPHGTSHCN
jgi:cyclophilin family peptidyl-prolyl cis-trans isomerase